jgi:hypothetical protein
MLPARVALAFAVSLTLACSAGRGPGAAAASPSPALSADPARPLPSPVPEVVARVNGEAIHLGQLLPMAKAELDRVSLSQRDRMKPQVLRHALDRYIERELLVQEALAQGVTADTRAVDRAYDKLRGEHADESDWQDFLARQGLAAESLKAELRVQHTVSALVEREARALPVSEEEARALWASNPRNFAAEGSSEIPDFEAVRPAVEALARQARLEEIRAALTARLRAKARIEIFL